MCLLVTPAFLPGDDEHFQKIAVAAVAYHNIAFDDMKTLMFVGGGVSFFGFSQHVITPVFGQSMSRFQHFATLEQR
jgi:hypothetical protein